MKLRPKPPEAPDAEGQLMPTPRLTVEMAPSVQLHAKGLTARHHSKKQVRQIAASMKKFGLISPILVDAENNVICGFGRLLAAQYLRLTELPVIRVEHLSEAEILTFQIADNRLAETSIWNQQVLNDTLRDLSLMQLDFDLTITGFEMGAIDLAILSADAGMSADEDDDAPPAGPAITRVGDVWEVLGHRVLCGDSLLDASYTALMGADRAAMTVADVPFNVAIQGNAAGFGKVRYAEFAMASGEMSEAEFIDFLITAHRCIATWSAEGALAYIFIDWRHLFEALVAGRRCFAGQRNLCVWTKPSGGQGSFYRSQHELVLVWIAKAGKLVNNIQLGRFGRSRSNIWSYDRPTRPADEEGSPMADHATPKPVALVTDAILDCTARGDIVLDPFLGGGATLIAAERAGRRCRGIEIEPCFVDAALRRLRRLTGEDARRVGDGRMFADLEREAADVR